MKTRNLFAAKLLGLVLLAPLHAGAEAIPSTREIESIRSAGMGSAARGSGSGTESLLVNPAAIAGVVRFNMQAQAVFEPAHGFRVLGIDAVDSKINADQAVAVSGGFGYYHYQSGEGDARRSGSIIALGVALPLLPEQIFVGVTGKYLNLDGAVASNAVTADAGVLYKPLPSLGIGAVGYNLVDVRSAEARRAWGFGLALGREPDYHLDFDVRLDPDAADKLQPTFYVGGEVLIGGLVMPRAGYVEDKLRDARLLTGGVSVVLGPVAIEGMYRHAISGGEGRMFGFALRLLDSPF